MAGDGPPRPRRSVVGDRRSTRPMLRRRLSSAVAPRSPLASYKEHLSSHLSIQTGLTHVFSLRSGVDRSNAQNHRLGCRAGSFDGPTYGAVPGFVQASLVALPERYAFDFLRFCLFNRVSCPLLEVTAPGNFMPGGSAGLDPPTSGSSHPHFPPCSLPCAFSPRGRSIQTALRRCNRCTWCRRSAD